MHQTVGNILRTLLYSDPPQNMAQARDIIDSALATAMHATRTTVATTLGSTPGALAFSRDMFLNVSLMTDWQTIAQNREQFIMRISVEQTRGVGNMTMRQTSRF